MCNLTKRALIGLKCRTSLNETSTKGRIDSGERERERKRERERGRERERERERAREREKETEIKRY